MEGMVYAATINYNIEGLAILQLNLMYHRPIDLLKMLNLGSVG